MKANEEAKTTAPFYLHHKDNLGNEQPQAQGSVILLLEPTALTVAILQTI